ncbi:Hypothetical protein A7982_06367 [Minicystis rosea]|nr:Hypothetical protein A7982_06367 [Minicystis rosea]
MIDPSLASSGSEARAFLDELTGHGHTSRKPTGFEDHQRLFLLVPHLQAEHNGLLAWARESRPTRIWHADRAKAWLAPHDPVDFLARLEERRHMAADLQDWMLAAELGKKLSTARAALLRRDIAGLVHVMQNARAAD